MGLQMSSIYHCAIMGYSGAGKDTYGGMVVRELERLGIKAITSQWAQDLKRVIADVFDLPLSEVSHGTRDIPDERIGGATIRQALETIGQAFRDVYPHVWVERRIKSVENHPMMPQVVVWTDTRYRNELDRCQRRVWVHRPGFERNGTHPSRTSLHEWDSNWLAANTSLPELQINAKALAHDIACDVEG